MSSKIIITILSVMMLLTTGIFFKSVKHKHVEVMQSSIEEKIDQAKVTTWDECWEKSRN